MSATAAAAAAARDRFHDEFKEVLEALQLEHQVRGLAQLLNASVPRTRSMSENDKIKLEGSRNDKRWQKLFEPQVLGNSCTYVCTSSYIRKRIALIFLLLMFLPLMLVLLLPPAAAVQDVPAAAVQDGKATYVLMEPAT